MQSALSRRVIVASIAGRKHVKVRRFRRSRALANSGEASAPGSADKRNTISRALMPTYYRPPPPCVPRRALRAVACTLGLSPRGE